MTGIKNRIRGFSRAVIVAVLVFGSMQPACCVRVNNLSFDIHPTGLSKFGKACLAGNLTEMLVLLDHANVNEACADGGLKPLDLAILSGKIKVVICLLDHRASVNSSVNYAGSKGLTPLHVAAQIKDPAITELLLKHGAAVNAEQVLVYPSDQLDDSAQILKLTPLDVALLTTNRAVAAILRKHGAISLTGAAAMYDTVEGRGRK